MMGFGEICCNQIFNYQKKMFDCFVKMLLKLDMKHQTKESLRKSMNHSLLMIYTVIWTKLFIK